VDVDFDAGQDVVIPLGATTQLHASGGTTYLWSPASGLSGNTVPDPIAGPTETTLYTVTTELEGCTFMDTVRVSVVRLIDPVNTFTPNGDGINDTWDIPTLADYPQADVSVYDRWGQRVFHSLGYKAPFDGAGLPLGTYYWYIQLNNVKGSSDPYTGAVTIIR
jgi:gliding motility-associated-like protein